MSAFNDLDDFEAEAEWTNIPGLGTSEEVFQMIQNTVQMEDDYPYEAAYEEALQQQFLGNNNQYMTESMDNKGNATNTFLYNNLQQQQLQQQYLLQLALQQQQQQNASVNATNFLQPPRNDFLSKATPTFGSSPSTPYNTTLTPASPLTSSPGMTPLSPVSSPSTPFNTGNSALRASPMNVSTNVPLNTNTTNGKTIHDVHQTVSQIARALEKLRWDQKQVLLPIQRDAFLQLDHEQKEVKKAIEWADKTINQLLDSVILDSNEMHYVLQIEQDLALYAKQLDLYIQELQGFQKENALPCFSLHIITQPFPDSVKQHKSIDENLTIRLLTGAKFDTRPACTVKAEIMNSSSKNSVKKHAVGVENGEKSINESGLVSFNDLKFPTGTRLKSIRVKFTARINITDARGVIHAILVESNPSNAIVVKTNENQWFEAEGILLKKTAFGGQTDITWCRFANWMQRRYLGATRQNLQSPVRPLSSYDLQYLHKLKFDSKPTINQKEFDNFWSWFGPLLHKIRYQRHVATLWTRGFICGFLTREEVDSVLKNEHVGTFLIRFSERSDKFVVSYQSAESVKHYMLKNDDTHGAKKTLPDFLRDYKDFVCLLAIHVDKDSNKRILRRCEKEAILKEFYSKKSTSSSPGYEDVIQVQ